jgi:hypothetical protein
MSSEAVPSEHAQYGSTAHFHAHEKPH